MALDCLLDVFTHGFYVLVPFLSMLSIAIYVRQTMLASSLVSFLAHSITVLTINSLID